MTKSWGPMMRSIHIAIVAVLLFPASAQSEEVYKTASSGQRALIYRTVSFNADCSYSPFKFDVVREPEHGKVQPQFEDHVIGSDSAQHAGGIGACAGKRTRGLALYYTSKSGFKGQDTLSIKASNQSGSIATNIIIEVQ